MKKNLVNNIILALCFILVAIVVTILEYLASLVF